MEPNDPIWKLLEKAPLREPDAWFAARTVARLRREVRPAGWRRFLPMTAWAGATAAIVLGVLHFTGTGLNPLPEHPGNGNTAKIQDALNYIADRGAETDQWLASSTQ